ncbi:hypothetical protein AJ80_01894 [Polytolypa hystricis UAMH7299]|uniref:Signal peptide peptidase n=1 Tax=Polytolypa hystricis (strain UAMH7299) TaxID=1447883 RepID=A0A2B7YXL5_POLH7|nr:hypothetical protein AJ80_01894 [Polytolypa hystricis UAMH7299]
MGVPTSFAEIVNQIVLEFDVLKPLIPTYSHLLVSALFPIYIGAHASLARPSSARKPERRKTSADGSDAESDDDDEQGAVQKMEGLEPSDAIMFPIMAGSTLAGLYFLIKWLEDPAILNKFLGWYFSQAGIIFAVAFVKDSFSVVRSFIFPSQYYKNGQLWKVDQTRHVFEPPEGYQTDGERSKPESPLPGILGAIPLPMSIRNGLWSARGLIYQKSTLRAYIRSLFEIKTRFTILDVASIIIALAAVGYFTFVAKPWWLTNFLGFSFCYGALQFMSPTTFWTGTLILSSLFFYDIYFVFFTPLMVTVAKKLDIPIKLLFPRPPSPGEAPGITALAMLGLGDIVIPGMMIGLALRFDLFLHYKLKAKRTQENNDAAPDAKVEYVNATGRWGERFWTAKSKTSGLRSRSLDAKRFPKTYFHAGILGYVIGMVTTLLAMQISGHAQPALLYLVPGVLASLWTTAYLKGDIKEMWNFSDAIEDEESPKDGSAESDIKPEQKSVQGIFSKALFGGKKSDSTALAKKLTGSDEGSSDPSPDQEGKSKQKPSERNKSELISFSISLPVKPAHAHTEKQQKDIGIDRIPSSEALSESSSSGVVNRDGEPPLKKRRGVR